jgi:outer membrane protein assembly factor BamB
LLKNLVARLVTKLAVIVILSCVVAVAGDWLTVGGDAQHSSWQRFGKRLTTANAKDLKLLWKRHIDGAGSLSPPVILGPTITHRGVRELVISGDAANNLYAIDADFGSVFWKVHLDSRPGPDACTTSPPSAIIQPDPEEDSPGQPINDENDHDDEPDNMRPVYVVAGNGRLHTIRPTDGAEMAVSIGFLPHGAMPTAINFASDRVYATASASCGAKSSGMWAVDVKSPNAKPASVSEGAAIVGPTVAFDSAIYYATGDKLVSPTRGSFTAAEPLTLPPVIFYCQRRVMLLTAGRHGIFLLDALLPNKAIAAASRADELAGGAATWQDSSGTRWIYLTTRDKLVAFRLTGTTRQPKLEPAWESDRLSSPGSPVVTRGVVMTLANGPDHATLFAIDAATGQTLYSSRDPLPHSISASPLALANGHICFSIADTLYCFGIELARE